MAEVRRLAEVEHGRWAWVLKVVPDEPHPVPEGAGAWCPLASDGVCRRADCLGDECPRARR